MAVYVKHLDVANGLMVVKGYGFLTTVGTENPTDVFVHHSNVKVGEEQYKYLVEGEYVSFNLTGNE